MGLAPNIWATYGQRCQFQVQKVKVLPCVYSTNELSQLIGGINTWQDFYFLDLELTPLRMAHMTLTVTQAGPGSLDFGHVLPT